MNNLKIIIYEKNGPYHSARIREIANKIPEIMEIELSSKHNFREWKTNKKEEFKKITLFNEPLEQISGYRLFISMFKTLNKMKPNTLIIAGYSNPAMRAAAIWARINGAKTVLLTESQYEDGLRKFIIEKLKSFWINFFYDAAFVGGKSSRDYLIKLKFPKNKIWAGYDVIDNDFFKSNVKKVDKNRMRGRLALPQNFFLYVGRFAKEKNLNGLLKAYGEYKSECKNSWGLVLVGNGPESQKIKALADDLKLSDIIWPGFIQIEELPKYYACASAFVLPSISEPWGLVVNEAMASGLPVLVSDRCGSAKDLVMENHNGFIFNPSSAESLKSALLKMSSQNDKEIKQMGTNSSRMIKNFGLKNHAESLLNCINGLKK